MNSLEYFGNGLIGKTVAVNTPGSGDFVSFVNFMVNVLVVVYPHYCRCYAADGQMC